MRVFQFDYLQDPEHRGRHFDKDIGEDDVQRFDNVSQKIITALHRLHLGRVAGLEVVAAVSVCVATKPYTHFFSGDSTISVEAEPNMLLLYEHCLDLWLVDSENAKGRYKIATLLHSRTFPLIESGNGKSLREMVQECINKGIAYAVQLKQQRLAVALKEAAELQAEIARLTSTAKWDPLIPWPD